MPIIIKKTKKGYKVSTPGGMKSKGTSKKKAEAQERLLMAVEHNPSFKPGMKGHRMLS